MNLDTTTSPSDFISFQDEYKTNWFHFGVYNGLRLLQMIVGFIGNGLTLKVIWNLKVLENGHILIIYSTLSNILINCLVSYETYTALAGALGKENWKTLCTWQDLSGIVVNGLAVITYFVISVDRYLIFVHFIFKTR